MSLRARPVKAWVVNPHGDVLEVWHLTTAGEEVALIRYAEGTAYAGALDEIHVGEVYTSRERADQVAAEIDDTGADL